MFGGFLLLAVCLLLGRWIGGAAATVVPSTYRIIYAVDKRHDVVNVLHIRHGARAALSTEKKRQL
jgi:P pilus assembly chaperone PapD